MQLRDMPTKSLPCYILPCWFWHRSYGYTILHEHLVAWKHSMAGQSPPVQVGLASILDRLRTPGAACSVSITDAQGSADRETW